MKTYLDTKLIYERTIRDYITEKWRCVLDIFGKLNKLINEEPGWCSKIRNIVCYVI